MHKQPKVQIAPGSHLSKEDLAALAEVAGKPVPLDGLDETVFREEVNGVRQEIPCKVTSAGIEL